MLSAHFDYLSGRASLEGSAVTSLVLGHLVYGVVDGVEAKLLKSLVV